jgi:hypothetical protein
MSYLYVPGLGWPTLESNKPFEGTAAPYATSSGTPTPRPSSWRGWKTRPWISRLSGTISRPLMATRCAAVWISCLQDSLASRIQVPARGPRTLTNGLSGQHLCEWYKNASRPSSFLRMFPVFSSTRRESTTPFERWASNGLRRCYKPPMRPALLIRDGDSISSLPTPTALAYGSNKGGAAGRVGDPRPSLDSLVKAMPPHVPPSVVRAIPTPTAGDSKASGAAGYSTASGRHSGTTLTDWVAGATSEGRTGKLNPLFSEWMMGLPIGWTSQAPLKGNQAPLRGDQTALTGCDVWATQEHPL